MIRPKRSIDHQLSPDLAGLRGSLHGGHVALLLYDDVDLPVRPTLLPLRAVLRLSRRWVGPTRGQRDQHLQLGRVGL